MSQYVCVINEQRNHINPLSRCKMSPLLFHDIKFQGVLRNLFALKNRRGDFFSIWLNYDLLDQHASASCDRKCLP